MAELRVGTSGWHYDHWAGDFYPPGLPRPRWFEHYVTRFNTVEINNNDAHGCAPRNARDFLRYAGL